MRKTKAIRQEIKKIIDASGVDFTVYDYDKRNISDNKLPAITIQTGAGVYSNGAEECDLVLFIKIHDKNPKIQDTLDDHAEIIEPIFPIGSTLNNLVEYMNPESFSDVFDESSSMGIMTLVFNINYEV